MGFCSRSSKLGGELSSLDSCVQVLAISAAAHTCMCALAGYGMGRGLHNRGAVEFSRQRGSREQEPKEARTKRKAQRWQAFRHRHALTTRPYKCKRVWRVQRWEPTTPLVYSTSSAMRPKATETGQSFMCFNVPTPLAWQVFLAVIACSGVCTSKQYFGKGAGLRRVQLYQCRRCAEAQGAGKSRWIVLTACSGAAPKTSHPWLWRRAAAIACRRGVGSGARGRRRRAEASAGG